MNVSGKRCLNQLILKSKIVLKIKSNFQKTVCLKIKYLAANFYTFLLTLKCNKFFKLFNRRLRRLNKAKYTMKF